MQFPIPDLALTQHTAILGKTGSGKTTVAKSIVEHVVEGGARVCVLDPIKSDWWGLTSSRDGKHGGLPFVILGGPRGYVPLHATSGKAIAEIVGPGTLPLSILDMADFGPGGQQRFFIDFASTLLKKIRGVLYLVMEEAHLFAPKERAGFGDENLAIHWAKMLATAGRSKGVRLILATQRTQSLHNALLGSCDTMIAMRMTAPADQEPVLKWLKANVDKETAEKIGGSLSSLKTGSAWVCSGESRMFELVPFRMIKTYDNTATPTEDIEVIDVKHASVDIASLKAIIGDAVKEAEANDPKALRAEIAKLRGEIGKRAPQIDADHRHQVDQAYDRGYSTGANDAIHQVGEQAFKAREKIAKAISLLTDADTTDLNGLGKPTVKITSNYSKPIPAPVAQRTERRPPKTEVAGSTPAGRANGELSAGADGLLKVMVRHHPVLLTWTQACVLDNRKARGGHFNSCRRSLIDLGYVCEEGGGVRPTKAGIARAGGTETVPTDLLQAYLEALPDPAKRMLAVISEAGAISTTDLGARLNLAPRGGHWNNGLSTLARCNLIERAGDLIKFNEGVLAP